MKIQSSITKQIYFYDPGTKDKQETTCPECSPNRRKKTDKCFTWYNKDKRGYCHHCHSSFFEFSPHEEKQYFAPTWKNLTNLTGKAVKYFEGRMISQKTLNKMRVYTDTEFMPQLNKEVEVMCFPYFFKGKLVNIKYRGPKKSFKLVSGAELILWNLDCILEAKEVIIVEGEIDALTFVENGYNNVLSVPNGASSKCEYLDSYIDMFKAVEKVFIATDQDTPGIVLRDELIRRIGAEKCYIVSFKECKDANEYFCKYGDPFKEVIPDAKAVPVKGIIEACNFYADIRDLYEKGVQPGKTIGIQKIDEKITWETGRLAIVTGVPGSGKSEFVDYLITKLNIVHGWKAAYFTPENYPLKYHYAKVYEKLIGKKFSKSKSTELEFDMAYDYVRSNFFYILNEEDFTIKSILESAKILVKSKGIKILVIDPYNKLEHQYKDSETQYISRFLDQIITFAKVNDILLFLVAHPVKMAKVNGKFEVPSLYSISGSANFYNKTDYGLTVHRKAGDDGVMINEVEVHIQKVKYKHLGEQGIIDLYYDYDSGRFNPYAGCDLSNWLIKDVQYEMKPNEDFDNYDFTMRTDEPAF